MAGRDHHAETIMLCVNDHAPITLQQERYWPQGLPDEAYRVLGWDALIRAAGPFGRDALVRCLAQSVLTDTIIAHPSAEEGRTDDLAA